MSVITNEILLNSLKLLKQDVKQKDETIGELKDKVESLEHTIKVLQKNFLPGKSERFTEVPSNQTALDVGPEVTKESSNPNESLESQTSSDNKYKGNTNNTKKGRQGANRNPFPGHLDRVEEVTPISDEIQKKIDSGEAKIIGYDKSEFLAKRNWLYVRVIKKPKIVFPDPTGISKETIYVLPAEGQPILRSIADSSVFSWVLISRYIDHLPFYRLQKVFKRDGVVINRSTMVGWIKKLYTILLPIYKAMEDHVKQSAVKLTDDTGFPAIYKKTKKQVGRIFVFVAEPCVVYAFHENKSADCPMNFFEGSKDYLVSDDAPNFNKVIKITNMKHALCWAHARRKFHEALYYDEKVAAQAISKMKELFELEAKWKWEKLSADEITGLRQKYSKPIVLDFEIWVKEQIVKCKKKDSPIAKALGYFDNSKEKFKTFLENGNIPISNNSSERAIKTAVLGRKNSMFFVSEDGAKAACLFYSLFETCLRLKVNPTEYLMDLLPKARYISQQDAMDWTPMSWAKRNPPKQG